MRTPFPALTARLSEAFSYAASLLTKGLAALRRIRSEGLSQRQLRQLRVIGVGALVAIVLCVPMALVIAGIASDPSGFASFVDGNPVLSAVAFALVNTLALFAAVIPGKPLEIVAGYLFGTLGGLLVVECGLALGEVAVFLAVRRWGTRLVGMFVSQKKIDDIALFQDSKRLGVVAFLMMLIPGTPKDIVTYIVGLTPMGLGKWLALSLPARALPVLSSTIVGDQAAQNHWWLAAAIEAAMLLVSVLGVAYYLLITKQARTGAIIERVGHEEWVASGSRRNDAASAADLAWRAAFHDGGGAGR